MNHSWHATLYVTPRGLTTGVVPDEGRSITLDFDFCDHRLIAQGDQGASEGFSLESMSVAEFLARTKQVIAAVGGSLEIHEHPSELPNPVAFAADTRVRDYDAAAVERYHAALLRIQRVFERFRTAFLGKVSPVHLFWGALDLAITRFSGRSAPLHPGGRMSSGTWAHARSGDGADCVRRLLRAIVSARLPSKGDDAERCVRQANLVLLGR